RDKLREKGGCFLPLRKHDHERSGERYPRPLRLVPRWPVPGGSGRKPGGGPDGGRKGKIPFGTLGGGERLLHPVGFPDLPPCGNRSAGERGTGSADHRRGSEAGG